MSRMRREGWILIGAVAVAVGLVTASRTLVPEPPRRMALPTASELVELERYLEPVARTATPEGVPPRVVVEGNPFGTAPVRGGGESVATGRAPPPRWAVTAIMIAGSRRVAIVNDQVVRPGDRLGDGARIDAVERDHVVLITPSGERRRLELER